MKAKTLSLMALVVVLAAMIAFDTRQPATAFGPGTKMATVGATMAATLDPAYAKTTLVRIVHASPNSPDVDIYLDKASKAAVTKLTYGKATDGYFKVPAGEHQVTITAAGDSKTIVFDNKLTLKGSMAVTLVAEGQLSDKSFTIAIFADNLSVSKGKVRLNVIHAVPDAPSADIVTGDFKTVLVQNLKYGTANTEELKVGTYDLLVVPHGKKDVLIDLKGTKLEADKIYTVIAIGTVSTKDKADVKSLILVSTPILGLIEPTATPEATALATKATTTLSATPQK